MKRLLAFGFLFFALSSCAGIINNLNGCEPDYVQPNWGQLQTELSNAKTAWKNTNITNYSFILNPICFCPVRELAITTNGFSTTAVDKIGNTSLDATAAASYRIEALHEETSKKVIAQAKCNSLSVKYASNGVPTNYAWADKTRGLADAFYGYTIAGFTATP